MADLSSVVEIVFSGIDRVSDVSSRVASNVRDSFGGLGDKLTGIATPFADLADKLLVAEAAILSFGAAMSVAAVNETVKFQDSLYDVQKQLGDTGPSIDVARKAIEDLAAQYGKNANDIAASLAGFLAAGNDYETSVSLINASTSLMIAGQLEAQFATDAITKSLAGFRVPAEETATAATHIGDVLNKIGDISSGKFEEIVEGFSRISPTAKDAGFSIEEAAASIAVLVDVFGSGEIAATALKSGLLSLLTPSTEAKKALDGLKVSTTDSNGQLRSSKEIITDLAGRWGTLTDAQKQQTAAIIFGKDQAGAMSALLGGWSKEQDYLSQMLDKTTGAVGSMAREVEGKMALISTALDRSNEAWRQFLEHIGQKITADGSTKELVDSVTAVGNSMKSVVDSGGFAPLITLIQSQSSELTSIFNSVAGNLPEAFKNVDWSGLISSLEGLKSTVSGVFKDFFGSIDITTVEGLTKAIQTVINTMDSLTVTVTGIIGEFSPFAAAIGETIRNFNELDNSSKLEFGQTLGGMKALIDAGVGVGAALIAIGKSGVDMGSVLDVVFGLVKVGVNAVQVAFDTVLLGIMSPIAAIAEGMINLDDLSRKLRGQENAPKSQLRQELDDILVGFNAVLENANRNSQELHDGWSQATGEAAAQTNALNDKLDKSKEQLLAVSAAAALAADKAKQAALDFSDLKARVGEAADAAQDTADRLNSISLKTPKFEIDTTALTDLRLPDLTLNASPIPNIFEAAISGANEFTAAAEKAKFGTSDFQSTSISIRDIAQAFGDGKQQAGDYALTLTNAGNTIKEVSGNIKDASLATGDYSVTLTRNGEVIKTVAGHYGSASKEVTALQTAQHNLDSALGSSGANVGQLTSAFQSYMSALGQSGKLTTDQFINLTKVTSDFKAKMEEIASNERIKNIEFAVQLKTAELDADVKRVQAAFESIDNTVSDTGKLIGDLFGDLIKTDNVYDKMDIKNQIELENERRQKALDLQAKLVEAEIDRINAQTDALNRGDALIQVDGKGLQPELEAFMWKILDLIRIRANAEFSEYLLGLGVAS